MVEGSSEDGHTLERMLIDLIVAKTGIAMGLYERGNGREQLTITEKSWGAFRPFCQEVRRSPERRKKCDEDHLRRAAEIRTECTRLCHAGLYNCELPILLEDSLTVTLMGGQVRIQDKALDDAARKRFDSFARECNLSPQEKQELYRLWADIAPIPRETLESEIFGALREVRNLYLQYWRQKVMFQQNVEDIAHEFLIQVQALVAKCENLYMDMCGIPNTRKQFKLCVQDIMGGLTKLDVIVQNHLESYLQAPSFTKEPIGPVIHESINLYTPEASQKGVTFNVNLELIDNKSPMIEMSRPHLIYAFHNLIQNAVKYSFSGAPERKRWIDVEGWIENGNYFVSIQNFGVGIEEEELEKIFEKGYQGKHTKTERRTGSGCGLYYVKRVIDMHHGEICVSSKDCSSGWLTTFKIKLPFEQPRGEVGGSL